MRYLVPLVVTLVGGVAHAQPQPEPKDGKVVIPLTLTPAGVKKPVSRYYLTPQYQEMRPGNRVPTFMRSYMEQRSFFTTENHQLREKWNTLPLADLPVDAVRTSGCVAGLAYREPEDRFASRGRPLADVDEGARQLTADWQMWFNIREDGIHTLLPEVQKMRELASVLKVRMRHEIRTGEIDKAIYSARTFNGLATSFETHPTLIAMLVGLAITAIEYDAIEELIQQPGCPNLYWSFVEIPADVLTTRIPAQGERLLFDTLLGSFNGMKAPMTDQELNKHLAYLDALAPYIDSPKGTPKYSVTARQTAGDERAVAAARKVLTDTGTAVDLANKFPPLQAVVAADVRRYEVLLDDLLALKGVPYADAIRLDAEIEKRVKAEGGQLARTLLPTSRKVMFGHVRVKLRLAYLRTIEAIRLYAHEHDGKLPTKLGDVDLPLPLDPVTGKAFEYAVKDDVATLHGGDPAAPPPGVTDPDREPTGQTNRYYELRIKR